MKLLLGSALVTALVIGAVTAMMLLYPIQEVTVMPPKPRTWQAVGDANPGSGASGVLVVYVYPHQSDPSTYDSNISTATAYEWNDGLNASLGTDVPYDTAFDIVVKVRYNKTHAWNTTGHLWELGWIMGNMTCSDLSIGADELMNESNITASDTFIWIHYYLQDTGGGGGGGFTITHGQNVNCTDFKMQAWY